MSSPVIDNESLFQPALDNKVRLILFDNVQFIYELALAELELEAFDVSCQIADGLREFIAKSSPDVNLLRRRLAYFARLNNENTDYYELTRRNRTRQVNQYLTHWIYPYKGKFHPQMIRALLNIMRIKPGEIVLDPFVGSGTAALEAQLLGINFKGIDVSELCVLQSKVKTESVAAFREIIHEWARLQTARPTSGLDRFSGEASDIPGHVRQIRNEFARNFFQMAWLVALSDSARRGRATTSSFYSNAQRMLFSVQDFAEVVRKLGLRLGDVDIRLGDARKLPFSDNEIDGIVTSPPYSIALDYVENDAHALSALGKDLGKARENFIGVRGRGPRRMELYNTDIAQAMDEMIRVLRPGRFCSIVVGNATYSGKEIKTVEYVKDYMTNVLRCELFRDVYKIIFGLYNVMQTEHILIFRKK